MLQGERMFQKPRKKKGKKRMRVKHSVQTHAWRGDGHAVRRRRERGNLAVLLVGVCAHVGVCKCEGGQTCAQKPSGEGAAT